MTHGNTSHVSSATLETSVASNTINVAGSASGNSGNTGDISIGGNGNYSHMYGVSSVATNSGAGGSQSISVNVTASVGGLRGGGLPVPGTRPHGSDI